MPSYKLSQRSLDNLKGVHDDLVKVVKKAIEITPVDFTVLEGLRSKERQQELVADGKSKTMNSRHLTGHAVDIAPYVDGGISWDWDHYYPLAKAIKQAAEEVGVKVEWGGDWTSFKDGPHWQLPWETHPAR
ncbi:MAG: M15 family peptidase [Alphaproteobacteria bacterium]|jgi:peptidoglycan L-alanyl-D-glutamate endopeptidase CwlK|nr:M15 family peptidase [Alphaproteobacteria bacterium]